MRRYTNELAGMVTAFGFLRSACCYLGQTGAAHVDSDLATAVRTTVVVVFAWAVAFFFGAHHGLSTLDRRSSTFLVASGIASGLSWICYFKALSTGQATKVAPIDKLSVLFVILLAAPLLGEALSVRKIGGGPPDRGWSLSLALR